MRRVDVIAIDRDFEGRGALARVAGRGAAALFLIVFLPVAADPGLAGREVSGEASRVSPATSPSPVESPPPLIPVADLGDESDRALTHLRQILSQLRREVPLTRLEREIPSILESIAELKETAAAAQASQLTTRAIFSLREEWLIDDGRLDALDGNLRPRVQHLMEVREELRTTADRWKRSREAAEEASAPKELLERADVVLAAVREVEKALEGRLVPALALQGRIVEARLSVADGLDWIDAISGVVNRDLFRIDSPPLWDAFGPSPEAAPSLGRLAAGRISWGTLRELLQIYPARVGLHLLAVAGFLLLQLRLRRMTREGTPSPQDGHWEQVIAARPLSTTLLFAVMATFFLYPRAPAALLGIAGALSIFPVLILLPRLTTPQGKPVVRWIAVIFLVMPLSQILEGALQARLAHLVFTLAAILLFSWWLRPASPLRTLLPNPWRRASWTAAKVALAILILSLSLNVAGNLSLAQLLSSSTVNSAYLALVAYLAALVVQGLIKVIGTSAPAQSLNMFREHGERIRQRVGRWSAFGLLFLWLYFSAMFFGLSDPAVASLGALLRHRWTLGTVTISPGSVLVFVVTLWLSVLVSRLLRFVLEGDVFPRLDLERGVPATISMMVRYGFIAVGFLLAVAAAGVELGDFALIAGALGVGIGFGLQSVVNNFVCGLILMFERPIQIGDTIQVGTLIGRVRNIGVRASTIRTYDGADVVFPNANLISGEVVNWTLSDRLRRMEIAVGVAYGSQPATVLSLLERTAREHPEVLASPPPQALLLRFGDSSLDFALRCWTANFENWVQVQSEVAVRVHDALQNAGIAIPFPQRVVHLRESPAPGPPST